MNAPRTSHRDQVSAIAALTLSPVRPRPGLYVQTFPGEYRTGTAVASFRRDLLGLRRGPVVRLCDRGTMPQGDPIGELWGDDAGRLTRAYLPAYAPKRNPVEWLGSGLQYDPWANYFPSGVGEQDETVRGKLGAALRTPPLLQRVVEGASFPLPERPIQRKQVA